MNIDAVLLNSLGRPSKSICRPGGTGRLCWVIGLALLLNACATVGPDTIPRDRFDYAAAIRDSWKRELLQNIVNLRYGGPPVFLEVASIISQYELQGQVNAGASLNGSIIGGDVYNVGGNARYAERPTITYQPLTGPKFARNLLTPLPPASLLSLVQAGYPIEFLFRIGVRSINGIRNHADIGLMRQQEDPEFGPLLDALHRIQRSGLIGLNLLEGTDDKTLVLFFGSEGIESVREDIKFVRNTLKLSQNLNTFELRFGRIAPTDDVIAIQSRSILEILLEMAADVEVPPEHLADGRAPGFKEGREPGSVFVRIRSQREAPENAFAAMHFEDYWFWIDNRDMSSKRAMSFMMLLSSLTESGTTAQIPVVTIGAGQ